MHTMLNIEMIARIRVARGGSGGFALSYCAYRP
jgi:hypothetical protein